MHLDSHFSELAFTPVAAGPRMLAPSFYLRWVLRWTEHCIRRIHAQLDDEFGLDTQAPLYRELESLEAERTALVRQLEARGTR